MVQTTIWMRKDHAEALKSLSDVTRVPKAQFFREAIDALIRKYAPLLGPDSPLEGTAFEAAPAHAAMLAQRREPGGTIRPHEGLTREEPAAFTGELEQPGLVLDETQPITVHEHVDRAMMPPWRR